VVADMAGLQPAPRRRPVGDETRAQAN